LSEARLEELQNEYICSPDDCVPVRRGYPDLSSRPITYGSGGQRRKMSSKSHTDGNWLANSPGRVFLVPTESIGVRMPKKRHSPASHTQNGQRPLRVANRREELMAIVGQLIFTTLALSIIALVAALLHVDSHDFWEVLRAAISLQGILQGARMLVALTK
jgi:hypothetical protein